MGLIRLAVEATGVLALAGAGRSRRARRAGVYWPVPLMLLAVFVGARDLAALETSQHGGLPTSSLLLGVWAALVVTVVGGLEIVAARSESKDARALMAPALLIAIGGSLIADAARQQADNGPGAAVSGLFVVLAGALLLAGRLLASPAEPWRALWPAALLLGTVTQPDQRPELDPLAEARAELAIVRATWQREGRAVSPVVLPPGSGFTPVEVEGFRVDGNEVRVYLVAHDDHASPETHLSPRLRVPPTVNSVPHLHVGPHLVVVCLTNDIGFARRLDQLVRKLARPARSRLRELAADPRKEADSPESIPKSRDDAPRR